MQKVETGKVSDDGIPIHYHIGDRLGRGAYGEVFRCTRDDIKDDLAVKRVNITGVSRDSEYMKKLEEEIKMFRKQDHARIIKYYGSSWNETTFDIFLEYMPGGSIRKQLTSTGPFDEARTRRYTYQALDGLAYLHENKIIHRDVKGDNILLDATATNIKLSDFGTAKQLMSITLSNGANSYVGTAHWMSPELVRGTLYGRRTDIWSLGCTVVEMLTINPPWHDVAGQTVIFQIGNLCESEQPKYTLPSGTSDEARNFINLCFEVDAQKRKSAEDLMLEAFCKQERE